MPRHLQSAEIENGLPEILQSPKDRGRLEGIVARPERGARTELTTCEVSLAGGVHGDHWANGCWKSTENGHPHPDVQICIMNARCIALLAQERTNWAMAGDNLFIDMDLSVENLPPGQRLLLGTALLEITDTPHLGCAKFIERYGKDACVFVNSKAGKNHRLRGVYARVIQDGMLTVGDVATKTS